MDDNSPLRPSSAGHASGEAADTDSRMPVGADEAGQPHKAQRGAQGAQHEASRPARRPAYVRKPRPHRTQPPVNDVPVDDEIGRGYAYDSSYTVHGRGHLRSGAYRRARSSEAKVRQELKYGQYLSVPKGNREIFSSRGASHKKRLAIVIVAIALLATLVIVLWPK